MLWPPPIVAVVCIGIFYGTSREALLGPYLYYDIMPKTIYKINGQVYVPLTVDPESGKMADDIPYYIGSVSAEVKEFDFRTVIGPGKAAGKIEDDFGHRNITITILTSIPYKLPLKSGTIRNSL